MSAINDEDRWSTTPNTIPCYVPPDVAYARRLREESVKKHIRPTDEDLFRRNWNKLTDKQQRRLADITSEKKMRKSASDLVSGNYMALVATASKRIKIRLGDTCMSASAWKLAWLKRDRQTFECDVEWLVEQINLTLQLSASTTASHYREIRSKNLI